MSELTLVVLAAGLGTRFGGVKQREPVGPRGATLMEYSIYDALREGFTRVVFVVQPGTRLDWLDQRLVDRVPVSLAEQQPVPPLPAARGGRPWGTGQALLAAGEQVTTPFVALNADDFYGREPLGAAAAFLKHQEASGGSFAVTGYRLGQTMSPAGTVNRAVLYVNEEGGLETIAEVRHLGPLPGGVIRGWEAGQERYYPTDALVSMNLWAFTPRIFGALETGFQSFLASTPGAEDEFVLPDAVDAMMRQGQASVQVLPTEAAWCGLTHPQDRPQVVALLRDLVARGEYPESLWG